MEITNQPSARASRKEWIGLAVLSLACLVYVMDLTVLNLAIPQISGQLQPSSAELLWIIDIYGFVVAGSLITMGTLGDRIGRRKLLLIGAAAFAVISILAAFAPNARMLILARALLGLAGATVAPSTLSLIFNMFEDPRERSVAIGWWVAAFSAGAAVGPIAGGFLLEQFWWGSVFLLAVPVMALLLILGPRLLPEYRDPSAGRLDLASAGLALLAVLAVIFGLKEVAQGGVIALALASIVAGLVLGWLFVRRQRQLTDPLFDVALFTSKAFQASLVTYLLAVFVIAGYFLFIAQFMQLVLALSPLEAGLWGLPAALSFVVGSQVGPRVLNRYRPALVMGIGLASAAFGLFILLFVGGRYDLALITVASVIVSLGLAPVITMATELIVSSAPQEKAGAASGISETSGELGGALGIALLGSLGTAVYRGFLGPRLDLVGADRGEALDTLGGAVEVAAGLPADRAAIVLNAARAAFTTSMRWTSTVAAVAAVAIAILAWRMLHSVAPIAAHE
ncbi:MAG: MFS transporter [Acidimicrobiia bacterium]|nr:MFS transporter [Acidimicrobiia bacterium]